MKKDTQKNSPCCREASCCQVDAVVAVDARGQIVLPKEVREKVKINAGDKFVLVSMMSEGELCCLTLIKAERFNDSVKSFLGPVIKEIL